MSDAQSQMPTPNPKLKTLDPMIGTWKVTGRTIGADEDNISGEIIVEWLPGGFFLKQTTRINFADMFEPQGLELVGYDAEKDALTSVVYSNMAPFPVPYTWEMNGDKLTIHMEAGATMHATVSKDGKSFEGSWRPDAGHENDPGMVAYDLKGVRVK
jgi:hypothetical protein